MTPELIAKTLVATTVQRVENQTSNGVRVETRHDVNRDDKRVWLTLTADRAVAEQLGDHRLASRLNSRITRLERQVLDRNHGLVQMFVNRFTRNRNEQHADDYLSVGTAALWQAFITWDPERGVTLASYAWNRIKGDVQRTVARYEDPGLSYSDWTARPNVRQARDRLSKDVGTPTFEEIAATAGVSVATAQLTLTPPGVSLDAPVHGSFRDPDRNQTLADTLPAYETGGEATQTVHNDHAFKTAARTVSATELLVLIRAHGLDGGQKETLNGIVAMFGAGNRNNIASVLQRAERAVDAVAHSESNLHLSVGAG